jgi:hypothetical protein
MVAATVEIRASNARAVVGLAFSVMLRLVREGLVVRALVWPGLLTSLSIFISASYTVTWKGGNFIYTDQPDLVRPLEDEGFDVTLMDNPEALVLDRRADRAVWREGDKLVLGITWAESLRSRAEVRLRDVTGERWRLELPPSNRAARHRDDVSPVTGIIAGIVGLLFTLYGVVIGTGALYRDRSSGVLESDLALPIPRWVHPAARMLALAAVLGPAMVVSLIVVDSLLAMHELRSWMVDGFFAAVAGGALGIALMARADAKRGFSAPLSQGLMATMAMISLGYAAADIGQYLPLLSLGSAFANQHSSWTVAPITLLLAAAVAADFHRRECL